MDLFKNTRKFRLKLNEFEAAVSIGSDIFEHFERIDHFDPVRT